MGAVLCSAATIGVILLVWRISGWVTGTWDDDDNLGGYGP